MFTRMTDRDDCALGVYRKGEGGCRLFMIYQEGVMCRAYEVKDWAYTGGPHCLPLQIQEDDNEENYE